MITIWGGTARTCFGCILINDLSFPVFPVGDQTLLLCGLAHHSSCGMLGVGMQGIYARCKTVRGIVEYILQGLMRLCVHRVSPLSMTTRLCVVLKVNGELRFALFMRR